MNSTTPPKQIQKPPRSPGRLALVILGWIVVALVLLDLSPIGGNYRMYAAWIGCGRKPVAGNYFMNVRFFDEPSLYEPINLFPPEKYFCSADEAKAAGYESSMSYDIHHPTEQ